MAKKGLYREQQTPIKTAAIYQLVEWLTIPCRAFRRRPFESRQHLTAFSLSPVQLLQTHLSNFNNFRAFSSEKKNPKNRKTITF